MLNSVDAHPDDRRRLAGRRLAGELACIRSAAAPARHDRIPFGDLFVDREVKVGEGELPVTCHLSPVTLSYRRTSDR
jgi:hypothetical protein